MTYTRTNNNIIVTLTENIDLKETFQCGQCFRWEITGKNVFRGVAAKQDITVEQISENKVKFLNISDEIFQESLIEYFDFQNSYTKIKKELSNIHPFLDNAIKYSPDIRILNQDPFETLYSFIISQNNNIPRISRIIKTLCETFGEKISDAAFSFPNASTLASLSEQDLSILKCGFRVPYLMDAAKKVASHEINLDIIRKLPIEEARKSLMKISGVGPKIAECTLLYGMHRLEAFPIDVWIKRAINSHLEDFSIENFGKYAGVAQQYIFHYMRTAPNITTLDH